LIVRRLFDYFDINKSKKKIRSLDQERLCRSQRNVEQFIIFVRSLLKQSISWTRESLTIETRTILVSTKNISINLSLNHWTKKRALNHFLDDAKRVRRRNGHIYQVSQSLYSHFQQWVQNQRESSLMNDVRSHERDHSFYQKRLKYWSASNTFFVRKRRLLF
jgi:hypothetical protein